MNGGGQKTMRHCAIKSLRLFLAAMSGAALAAVEDWRPFPNSCDGVSVAFRVHYFPFDCDVNWRFKNNNAYPVKIEITDKIYITNYGEKLISDHYQTYAELQPGETKSMLGLGDHLSYNDEAFGGILNSRGVDKNGKKVTMFVVEGVRGWNYKVTKTAQIRRTWPSLKPLEPPEQSVLPGLKACLLKLPARFQHVSACVGASEDLL
jgi:hypothetical protein